MRYCSRVSTDSDLTARGATRYTGRVFLPRFSVSPSAHREGLTLSSHCVFSHHSGLNFLSQNSLS
jgi:hypothetical protein